LYNIHTNNEFGKKSERDDIVLFWKKQ